MAKEIPKIEQRNFDDLLNEFKALAPFYTLEWRLEEKGKGADLALVKIFIQYLGTIYHRLNRLPEKHFISFLHEIGIKRIPAQSAMVPVTFLLSEGTGGPVLITAGTQAAAGDVIFETEKNLLASPAKLVNIFHTDGEKDAIFPAPANIVSGEPALAVETKLLYPVNKGDKDIFVQSGEDLLEGDIVCIGKNNDGVEYGIVSAVSDNRVTLVHPLGVQEPGCLHLPTIAIHGIGEVFSQRLQAGGIYTVKQLLQYSRKVEELGEILLKGGTRSSEYYREQVKNILENAEKCVLDDPYKVMQESGPAFHHQPGTAVKKITSLELFKSKNLQEHILYLGHEELFNIAADALIIFRVTDPQWAAVLSDPGAVQWEYWGEAVERRAVGEEENPGWHPLEIRPGDPVSGEFYLRKLFTGEIAEYPLNDITSRWLRCKVKDINKTRDIELKDINVRVGDIHFFELPPVAIRGIGDTFAQRLAQNGISTIGQLLEYRDNALDLAVLIASDEQSLEYYREMAENFLQNAEKFLLDEEYEKMLISGESALELMSDMVFYKKITCLEFFDDESDQEKFLYLGHEELFNIDGDALIIFRAVFPQWGAALPEPGAVQWEYWGEAVGDEGNPGWHPLEVWPRDPSGGEFYLRKLFTDKIVEYTLPLNNITSRWLRCKVKDINKIKDIEPGDINVRVVDVCFFELPTVAIRGIGDTFTQRLAEKGIHTVEQLLEYKDMVLEVAGMIASDEKSLEYYREMAENFLQNAEKLVLDEEYEQLLLTGKSSSVLLPDKVFYKKIACLERSESENCLYLGHGELFNIDTDALIIFRVTISEWGEALPEPEAVQWEYWGEAVGDEGNPGWHPLVVWPHDPSGGEFYLRKLFTDKIVEYTLPLNNITSRWLRCKVTDINKIKDIEPGDINVRVVDVCFFELPTVAIRGIGDTFAQRLAEKGIHTVEKLLEYKDMVLEVAGMIASDKQPFEYYREMAENFLQNAEKLLLDEEYEKMLISGESALELMSDMVFYKKITCLEFCKDEFDQEKFLYLGHEELFNIDGDALIIFRVTLPEWGAALPEPGAVQWEYWGEAVGDGGNPGWRPLEVQPGAPSGGKFYLRKLFTDKIVEYTLNNITSRWLRCKVKYIPEIEDIEPEDINVIVVDVCFLELPTAAIRGIGDTFAQRLAEKGIHTAEQLLEYQDKTVEVAGMIASDEQPPEYYHEMAKNFLQNAKKHLLNGKYENKLIASQIAPVLPPDMVFYLDLVYDLTTTDNQYLKSPFHPFGKKPVLGGTFYISCTEFFSRPDIDIRMNVEFSSPGAAGDSGVELYWEYWDGQMWNIIKNLVDTTQNFTKDGEVAFTTPGDIASLDVNGKENFYIRVRIVSGDYGREEFVETPQTVEVEGNDGTTEEKEINVYQLDDSKIKPPVITKLLLSSTYEFIPEFYPLKHCLAFNNLELIDRVKESWDPGKVFKPFIPLEGGSLVFYLAFDRKLEKGPVTLFFAIAEKPVAAEQVPTIHWQYYNEKRQWQRLDVLDATTSLTRTGVIEFVFPPDFKETRIFSTTAYWIRAVYIEEEKAGADDIAIPTITGVFLNTTWALQRETISAEILGSGDGTANQAYSFTKTPVATGSEEIWVDEFKTISAEEQRQILEENQYQVKRELDEKENLTEFWIKWKPIDSILNASANDRYYEIDNVSGIITFGDGINGKILPTGTDNIKANYCSGGGKQGNLPVFEVTELKTSIPFLDSAFNPLAAGGGTDTEAIGRVMERGPYLLKHHNRAITVEDFEQLAFQAAGGIARVKCLPNMDEQRKSRDGRVTVIVIPQTEEEKPRLSLQMKYKVERHLRQRAAYRMVEKDYLRVIGPVYVEVSIHTQLAAVSIEMIPLVEKACYSRLKEFLNPLSGGNEKRGWDFGKIPCFSDFYALLEKIDNVDHVKDMFIKVTVPGIESTGAGLNSEYILTPENPEDFTMPPYAVICSGEHKVVVSWQ